MKWQGIKLFVNHFRQLPPKFQLLLLLEAVVLFIIATGFIVVLIK